MTMTNGTHAANEYELTIESFRATRLRALEALKSERAKLQARLTEIDGLLDEVKGGGMPAPRRSGAGRPRLGSGTLTAAIVESLRRTPGQSARDLQVITRHAAHEIGRMFRRGMVRREAIGGVFRYSLAEASA